MIERIQSLVTPEQFSTVVQSLKESIGWASAESSHSPPREFVDLLSNYLATLHFSFIHREAKVRHSMNQMTGSLSNRQREIMKLVVLGMTNKAIAETILMSEATVHHEVSKIFKAFSVVNRGELIDYVVNINNIKAAATSPPPPNLE